MPQCRLPGPAPLRDLHAGLRWPRDPRPRLRDRPPLVPWFSERNGPLSLCQGHGSGAGTRGGGGTLPTVSTRSKPLPGNRRVRLPTRGAPGAATPRGGGSRLGAGRSAGHPDTSEPWALHSRLLCRTPEPPRGLRGGWRSAPTCRRHQTRLLEGVAHLRGVHPALCASPSASVSRISPDALEGCCASF